MAAPTWRLCRSALRAMRSIRRRIRSMLHRPVVVFLHYLLRQLAVHPGAVMRFEQSCKLIRVQLDIAPKVHVLNEVVHPHDADGQQHARPRPGQKLFAAARAAGGCRQ